MSRQLLLLASLHILLITISNVLVQYPFTLFGWHTTWGAFSYPMIFLLTDLTARLEGPVVARRVIFGAMLPGLFISYLLAVLFHDAVFQGWMALASLDTVAFRVALACFSAYVIGQLLDIQVFQRFRQQSQQWWLAPLMSTTVGNIVDTILFFSIAFYQSANPVMRAHWPEIAVVDLSIKCLFSWVCIVPLYGLILNSIQRAWAKLFTPSQQVALKQ